MNKNISKNIFEQNLKQSNYPSNNNPQQNVNMNPRSMKPIIQTGNQQQQNKKKTQNVNNPPAFRKLFDD